MIVGSQLPRIESRPASLTWIEEKARLGRSAAEDTLALSSMAGLDLDGWQRYVIVGSLGRRADGKWSAFEVKLLVSRQNGKGSILEARELAGLYLFRTDRLLIHTAHEHKTASEHYMRLFSLIDNTPELRAKVVRFSSAYGREFIQLKPGPTIIIGAGGREVLRQESSRIIFIARTGASGRGFTGDFVAFDEDMKLSQSQSGATIPALGARPNPQVWYTGSAGDEKSDQLALVRRRGVAAANGERDPGRLFFAEWSINWHQEYCDVDCKEHDDPDSEEAVAKANPAYNIRRMPDAIAAEREALSTEQFEREILGVGVYPAPLEGWLVIPKKWFVSTADNTDEPPRVSHPVFAIEVSPNRELACISVAGIRPDGFVGIQVVEYRKGTSWIAARAREIQDKWNPDAWVIDKRTATGTVITDLERAGISVQTLTANDVAIASGMLYDAFRDDGVDHPIRHYNQGSLKTALAAVDKRKLSESWAFDRLNSAVDQCPLMSVAFAYWGYVKFGVQEDYSMADSVGYDLNEVRRYCRMGVYGPQDLKRLHTDGILSDNDLETLANEGYYY